MKEFVYLMILLLGVNLTICVAQEKNKTIPSPHTWTGGALSEESLNQAPEDAYISNSKDWIKLWRAWRLGEKIPKIDFKKNLIVFCAALTPNRCSPKMDLAAGDLKLRFLSTLIGSNAKTYNYNLIVIERAGIKTINGKTIKK